MTTRNLRVATICHNDDDRMDDDHRRVRLCLRRRDDGLYAWVEDGDEETADPGATTLSGAMDNLYSLWGAEEWDLRVGSR